MADKYLYNNAGVLTEREGTASSAGAGNAGDLVALDSNGLIDTTMMPVGIGADTVSLASSENLAAGDIVNIWDDGGTAKVRKADADAIGTQAHGFVLSSVTSPASATVYLEGKVTGLTSLTPGATYYLSTTAGAITTTAPSGSADIVQIVGNAVNTTTLNFEPQTPIVLA